MLKLDRSPLPKMLTFAAAGLLLVTFTAARAETADVAAGRRLALRACGECHATGPSGQSAVPDAPPFRRLHERMQVETLPSRFKDGLMTSHTRMPMIRLDAGEVAQLTAYLKSITPPAARRG